MYQDFLITNFLTLSFDSAVYYTRGLRVSCARRGQCEQHIGCCARSSSPLRLSSIIVRRVRARANNTQKIVCLSRGEKKKSQVDYFECFISSKSHTVDACTRERIWPRDIKLLLKRKGICLLLFRAAQMITSTCCWKLVCTFSNFKSMSWSVYFEPKCLCIWKPLSLIFKKKRFKSHPWRKQFSREYLHSSRDFGFI